jgi:type IV secretion system protein VirB6
VTGITPAPPQAAGWTAGDVLWMAALLLLLGTVGVLLVARIALAALLALGPVFIVFALFRGTHGLFVGWLKGAVMFALVPLFTVLIGGAALMLLSPIVAELAGGAITMRAAVIMFLGATVYVALMVLVVRVASVIVSGWWLGGGNVSSSKEDRSPAAASSLSDFSQVTVSSPLLSGSTQSSSSPLMSDRVRAVVESSRVPANDAGTSVISDRRTPILGAAIRSSAGEQVIHRGTPNDRRVQGLGARFRSPLPQAPGKAGS